ncbi:MULTISPECIES: YxeA family protein [unclassified Enterococcus]|uniref:YxeA family protein n=1 Tax=unclassified Enterococcus TaxID=2608891 RepID=UPI001A916896|nr:MULTISPECIES: YxeA family protein [unclassified Enterococcus]MBO0461656.1 YxeA family protein [Enterococcus sp. DIV1298c]MBO1300078.1 YxeA family protein [Enterococcus sp. DIV1271a]
MKKLIGVFVVLGIFLGGSFIAYDYFYGGETYYTKITTNGEKEVDSADDGMDISVYVYDQSAYNAQGEEKAITLREARERPLKMDAYLKLLVNPRKGVISWEEVKAPDVPEKALDQLDQ